MKYGILLRSVALAMACLPVGAFADVVLYNIQFNGGSTTYSGAAQLGTAGDVWNNPTLNGTSTDLVLGSSLVTSSGAASSVLFSATCDYVNYNAYTVQTAGGATPVLVDQLIKFDYTGTKNVLHFDLSGLPANADVSLYIYGSGGGSGQGGKWTLGSDSMTVQYDGSATGRDVTLAENQGLSWGVLAGTTSGTGTLSFTGTGPDTGIWWQTYTNGMQLQVTTAAVPEPSTCAVIAGLAALGCVGFVRRRRRTGA